MKEIKKSEYGCSKYRKIFEYIKSDYNRYGGKPLTFKTIVKVILGRGGHCFGYSFWFRLSSENNIFSRIAKRRLSKLTKQYGLQIPIGTKIGYGLYIGHGIGIVISPTATIGNNCNLSQFTTIGSNHGQAATIGDNVYIGPSVCIVENVRIGNNVSIGAGAVVVKDVPDNATVAGVPAKVISYNNPARYIGNRWKVKE